MVTRGFCTTAPNPDLWTSEDEDDRAEAARLCLRCPVITECGIGALERREPFGVWGGRDVTGGSKPGPKRKRLNPKPCEHCGTEFAPTFHGPAEWERARFCGNLCANRAKRVKREAA